MTGLLFSALPFLAACVVAHREPAHRPVRDALAMTVSYSFCSMIDGSMQHHSPRVLLLLWSLVAVYSGWAYLRAFAWDALEALNMLGAILVLYAGAFFWPKEPVWWQIATWGPFASSSFIGAMAVWQWWKAPPAKVWIRIMGSHVWTNRPAAMSIAQRVALILLGSDICMLLFIPWPGVQVWQGRAAAVAVFAVQLEWLINRKDRNGNQE